MGMQDMKMINLSREMGCCCCVLGAQTQTENVNCVIERTKCHRHRSTGDEGNVSDPLKALLCVT